MASQSDKQRIKLRFHCPDDKQFLLLVHPAETLKDVAERVESTHKKLYHGQGTPLKVLRLQDHAKYDLDPEFAVGEIFQDNDTVEVIPLHKRFRKEKKDSGIRPDIESRTEMAKLDEDADLKHKPTVQTQEPSTATQTTESVQPGSPKRKKSKKAAQEDLKSAGDAADAPASSAIQPYVRKRPAVGTQDAANAPAEPAPIEASPTRGRPKKQKVASEKSEKGTITVAQPDTTSAVDTPPKPKRGRPRKYPQKEAQTPQTSKESEAQPATSNVTSKAPSTAAPRSPSKDSDTAVLSQPISQSDVVHSSQTTHESSSQQQLSSSDSESESELSVTVERQTQSRSIPVIKTASSPATSKVAPAKPAKTNGKHAGSDTDSDDESEDDGAIKEVPSLKEVDMRLPKPYSVTKGKDAKKLFVADDDQHNKAKDNGVEEDEAGGEQFIASATAQDDESSDSTTGDSDDELSGKAVKGKGTKKVANKEGRKNAAVQLLALANDAPAPTTKSRAPPAIRTAPGATKKAKAPSASR